MSETALIWHTSHHLVSIFPKILLYLLTRTWLENLFHGCQRSWTSHVHDTLGYGIRPRGRNEFGFFCRQKGTLCPFSKHILLSQQDQKKTQSTEQAGWHHAGTSLLWSQSGWRHVTSQHMWKANNVAGSLARTKKKKNIKSLENSRSHFQLSCNLLKGNVCAITF